MKVLLMHKGDAGQGGGQVQMLRLASGLRARGVDAKILCRDRTLTDSIRMPSRPRIERWLRRVTQGIGLNDVHLLSSYDVTKLPEFREADLIDLHCLHHDTLSYMALPAITAAKPAVFTFHDMWPLTGHCHAGLECTRWKTGCGKCPHLDVAPAVRRDATAMEWKLKRRAYESSRFSIVAPSKWLHDMIGHSMLAGHELHHIPHGIDTELYKPLDKAMCRHILGIPNDKKVLVFGAESLARTLKGGDLLHAALSQLPESLKRETVLLAFGQMQAANLAGIGIETIRLGYLSNENLKVLALSAADVFVNPTRAENFPLVVMESMACATAVVSFAVGGVPEMVRPGETGVLAEPENPASLAKGIEDILSDRAALEAMERRCREVVIAEYSLELQARRYHELYQRVIAQRR
jgi:glycosyltransferase involved in cell wall biosynthesis